MHESCNKCYSGMRTKTNAVWRTADGSISVSTFFAFNNHQGKIFMQQQVQANNGTFDTMTRH